MPKIALLIFTLFFFATQVEANCGQVCDDAWLKLGKNPTETDLRAIITEINGIKPENAEKKLLLKVSDRMMKFIKNSDFRSISVIVGLWIFSRAEGARKFWVKMLFLRGKSYKKQVQT